MYIFAWEFLSISKFYFLATTTAELKKGILLQHKYRLNSTIKKLELIISENWIVHLTN